VAKSSPLRALVRAISITHRVAAVAAVLALGGTVYSSASADPSRAQAARRVVRAVWTPAAARQDAAVAAAALQSRYNGRAYAATQWWQSATALSATIGYMQVSGSRAYLADLQHTYQAFHGTNHFLNHYYDDEGWWALTWIAAYNLTHDRRYLAQAQSIFADMTGGWDGTCGGGIWWSKYKTYKNSIANEIFLDVAASLHNLIPGDRTYQQWALREWHWFRSSGLITRGHLVVDGLQNCRPDLSSPTWTYNQGVLIAGLLQLSRAGGGKSALSVARQVAHAVIRSPALSPHGILSEACEPSSCDGDEAMFKGIFIAALGSLQEAGPRPEYAAYLRANAASVWDRNRRGVQFGLCWSGPFDGSDTASQASALDALTAALVTRASLP
jgi:predicted alpha-1,6-mannanase (GH76 family)